MSEQTNLVLYNIKIFKFYIYILAYPSQKFYASKKDLSKYSEIEKLGQEYDGWYCNSPDVVVNNAAIVHNKTFLETTPEEFDRVIDINLKSVQWVSYYTATVITTTVFLGIPNLCQKGCCPKTSSIYRQYLLYYYSCWQNSFICLCSCQVWSYRPH